MTAAVSPLLVAVLLAVGALVLVGPGPSWVTRWSFLPRVPRSAVVLWQAGAVAALLCVVGVATLLARQAMTARAWPGWAWLLTAAAVLFAALVVARLGWALARVIGATVAHRRRHRDLVDLLAVETSGETSAELSRWTGLRVLSETQPLAYCLPGLRDSRVVLSAGTLAMLSSEEVAAVLAHEDAHLRARHDVVLATFDAVHRAFPHAIRSELPGQQARLLVEMLADDAAVRTVGRAPLARAMVALSGSAVPDGGLGAGLATRVRLERLTAPADDHHPWLAAAVYTLALALVAVPLLATLLAA